MYVQIQYGCHVVGQITLKKYKKIFTMTIIIRQLQLSKLRNDKNRFQTLVLP